MGNHLKKTLGKHIHENVTDRDLKKLFKYILNYIDRHSKELMIEGPFYQLILSRRDKMELFNTIHMDKLEVIEIIEDTEAIEDTFTIANVPFNIASCMLLRECILRKDRDLPIYILLFMSFRAYASLYKGKYFKVAEPNRNELMMVMNDKFNNSSDIKKLGSVYATMKKKMEQVLETYEDRLKRGNDEDIIRVVNTIHDRLNGWLRLIANAYYEFKDEGGGYINLDLDSLDEDDYHIADNDSFKIDNITTKVINSIINYGPDDKLIKHAVSMTGRVSHTSFKNSVEDVIKYDKELIVEVIKLALIVYYDENRSLPETFNLDFVAKCIGFYKRPNTSDKAIIRIKEILDEWLNKTNDTYRKTNRKATINKLRKALYTYFILCIMKYTK